MKDSHIKKLHKALELMNRAQELVNTVAAKDEAFRYSANGIIRDARIEAAISILDTEIEQAEAGQYYPAVVEGHTVWKRIPETI
jgi:hypothetical protein